MENMLRKLLLTELNVASYIPGNETSLTNEDLMRAVTVNENLASLGYTLRPDDIVKLATSASRDSFYEELKAVLPDVKAKPMYPNFPTQVMEMDEAEFRFHQMLHYFSTYGCELFSGVEVHKGWLPEVEDTAKTQEDAKLLELTVLELMAENKICNYALSHILSKCERMTLPETEIIKMTVSQVSAAQLEKLNVKFKENIEIVFDLALTLDRTEGIRVLGAVCAHTGDVLDNIHRVLKQKKYHFSTSMKKTFVKLLETYKVADFRANLMKSKKERERNLLILQKLDFNSYSRSKEHRLVVEELRNDTLKSWEAIAKRMLEEHQDGALDFVAKRPGTMLRMVNWLLNLGYEEKDIQEHLCLHSEAFSTRTLVKMMTYLQTFSAEDDYEKLSKDYARISKMAEEEMILEAEKCHKKEQAVLKKIANVPAKQRIFSAMLNSHFTKVETKLWQKKVYIDMDEIDLDHSKIEANEKSMDGGFIPSGIAYKIPEEADRVRFFVYWNDKNRVDVDLHANGVAVDDTPIHVGWNGAYNTYGVTHSGDITHSDAAEYIDIDLSKPVKRICTNIHLYSGKNSLKNIDECYVGMMAVKEIGQEISLYDRKNCFFSNEIYQDSRCLFYGYIDVQNRYVRFVGQPNRDGFATEIKDLENEFSLKQYLDTLFEGQQVTVVSSKEDADVVLSMGKSIYENGVSLVEESFFMDV